jgi:hypothetical protein
MPLILGTNSIKDTGYDVANSLRFNDGSSDNLSLSSLGTATNNKKQTLSFWCKRSTIGSVQRLFVTNGLQDPYFQFFFQSNDKLRWQTYEGSVGSVSNFITTRVFRDTSAWYHFHLVYDTTQSTSTDRTALYVNGVKETAYDTEVYPSLNSTTEFDNPTLYIGQSGSSDGYFDGYLAEFVVLDGQSITPDGNTGEFDSDSGIWKPIDVSGLTFGTNGFYLDFEDSSALGNDVSGNNNDFTANNLTAVDQSIDTCTNNFATLNPLDVCDADGRTLSNGNLDFNTSSGNNGNISGTLAVSGSGKWYFETKISAQSGTASSSAKFGIVGVKDINLCSFSAGDAYYIFSDGRKEDGANTTNSAHPGYSLNDIVQVALDLDNGNIYFGLNGNWGNNAGSFNQTFANATAFFTSISTSKFWTPYLNKNVTADNDLTLSANFGSPSFSISSGNTDGNGYGNFEYAVPSGYYALNTKNLAEYG